MTRNELIFERQQGFFNAEQSTAVPVELAGHGFEREARWPQQEVRNQSRPTTCVPSEEAPWFGAPGPREDEATPDAGIHAYASLAWGEGSATVPVPHVEAADAEVVGREHFLNKEKTT